MVIVFAKPHDNFMVYTLQGGTSLQNKSPRFSTGPHDVAPGPTYYNPKPIGKSPRREPPPGAKGNLYLCAVPYSVYASPPSVPTKADENGYDIIGGNVVKRPANTYDTSLGPAYYDVKVSLKTVQSVVSGEVNLLT